MTYVTGFFLVFAGMLIGYFLWYRDRSEEEQLRLARDQEADELRSSLNISQDSNSILEERLTRQKGQLNVLQQLCDDWSSSREQSERDRAQLGIEAEDKRKKYEEASADLQRAKQKQIELEDQVHALTQSHLESVNRIEQEWLKKHNTIESSLNARQSELKSTVMENERLTKTLHRSEATIAELKSEIEANQKLLETATKNAGGLKQEYVSLETSLQASSDLLKESRSECATVVSEKKVALASLASLQAEHKQLQAQSDELRAQLSAAKSLAQDVTSLKQSLAGNLEQLEKVTQQRDLALKAEKISLAMAAGLQSRLDNQESTIHGLREKHKDALESAKKELQARAEIESAFEKRRLQMEARSNEQTRQLELHTNEMKSKFTQESGEFEKQLVAQSKTIAELTTKRDQLLAELHQTRVDFSHTKSEVKKFEERTELLTAETAQLKTTAEKITQLESQLAERDRQLRNETTQFNVTQNRVEEMKTLLQQRDGQLLNSKKRVVELETLVGNQLEVTKNRFAEFQNRLQQRDDQLRASRKRVVELVAQMGKRDADSQNLNRQLEALRQQYTAVQQRQADLQSKMEGNSVNEEQFAALKLEYSAKTGSLQRKLKASEETIRTLRRERAGVLARLANYRTIAEPDATIISFKQAMEERKQVAYDQEYGGHTEEHATRGTVYTTEPESRDDLKRISGIAEVLEARLNDYGIYTFKQIMEWQPVAIEEFSRLLAFRDRIIRDDWKGQAKFFYQQKTQTSAA